MIQCKYFNCEPLTSLTCDTCFKAKGTRCSHKLIRRRSIKPLENVHVDLSGIIPTDSRYSYYILFSDDYSCYKTGYSLISKNKYEVLDAIKTYIACSERQTNHKFVSLTLDGGSEFHNNEVILHLKSLGISLRTTAPYTPEQNGVAKRGNRTVVERA